jgi:hypothetical protein
MTIFLKAIYRFSAIPTKIPITFLMELGKSFIWKNKRPPNSQSNPEQQKSNAGGIIVPIFKLYYRAILIKTVLVRAPK